MRFDRKHLLPALIWTCLMATSFVALYFEHRFSQDNGTPLAELTSFKGGVQVREKSVPIWSYADKNQPIYPGTVLATGMNGGAEVQFENGRILSLGAQSLVVFGSSGQQSDAQMTVTLVKGTISASVQDDKPTLRQSGTPKKAKALRRLTIEADDQFISVPETSERLLVKKTEVDSPATVSTMPLSDQEPPSQTTISTPKSADIPEKQPTSESLLAVAPDVILPATVNNVTQQAAKLSDTVRVIDHWAEIHQPEREERDSKLANQPASSSSPWTENIAPTFEWPLSTSCLWTDGAFGPTQIPPKDRLRPLPIRMNASAANTAGTRIRPSVFAQLIHPEYSVKFPASQSESDSDIWQLELASDNLVKSVTKRSPDPLGRMVHHLTIQSGVQLAELAIDSPKNSLLTLCSWPEQRNRLWQITLRPGENRSSRSKTWFQESPEGWFGSKELVKIMVKPQDLRAGLSSVLKDFDGFRIEPIEEMKNTEVYGVRLGRIISGASGVSLMKKGYEWYRQKIGADLVFKGAEGAFLPYIGVDDGDEDVSLRDRCSREIHIVAEDQIVKIDWSLIASHKEVEAFLWRESRALFCDRVDLVAATSR